MDSNTTFSQEFEGTEDLAPGTVNTEAPATVAAPKEKETYELADGSQGSRAAFIREKFINENMSRKDIATNYGFEYRVVYSATVNMVNEAEAGTRGRSVGNAVIKVNADNQLVEVKTNEDGSTSTYVNGELTDVVYGQDELTDKARNVWIQEVIAGGMSRGDVANILDLSYGVIYSLTKEADGTRTTHMVTLEDGTEVSRAEYIRQLAASGMERGEIAKQLDVPYSVVWQATKTQKTAQEKYNDLVAGIKAFREQFSEADQTVFDDAIVSLEALVLTSTEADEKAEADAAAAAAQAEA